MVDVLHDLIFLLIVAVVAYVVSQICFVTFKPERFESKMDWWKAEGILIFLIVSVGLVLLGLARHMFHSLR
jgi:hypothetical protein